MAHLCQKPYKRSFFTYKRVTKMGRPRARQPTTYIGTCIALPLAEALREEAFKTGKTIREILETSLRLYFMRKGGEEEEKAGAPEATTAPQEVEPPAEVEPHV